MSFELLQRAWLTRTQNRSDKLVLVFIADHCNPKKQGLCWPSLNAIADATGLAKRRVIDSINRLEADQIIGTNRNRGKHRRNNYWLLNADGSTALKGDTASPLGQPRQGDTKSPDGGRHVTSKVTPRHQMGDATSMPLCSNDRKGGNETVSDGASPSGPPYPTGQPSKSVAAAKKGGAIIKDVPSKSAIEGMTDAQMAAASREARRMAGMAQKAMEEAGDDEEAAERYGNLMVGWIGYAQTVEGMMKQSASSGADRIAYLRSRIEILLAMNDGAGNATLEKHAPELMASLTELDNLGEPDLENARNEAARLAKLVNEAKSPAEKHAHMRPLRCQPRELWKDKLT